MKIFICTLSMVFLLTLSPCKTKATGIPVIDGANLAENIVAVLTEIAELSEIMATYELLMEEYEKWMEIIDLIYMFEHWDTDMLMKIFEDAGLGASATAGMGSPAVEAGDIWGAENPPARIIYEKRADFIHSNIEKVNTLHTAIIGRQEKIRALSDDIATNTEETSPKELATIQANLLIEQTLMQNEQMLIQLINTEVELGIRALELEAEGSMKTKRSGLSDVK